MGQALLVTIDVPNGKKIVEALPELGVKVNVAMWAHLSDYEDWRFILSSRDLDEMDPFEAHKLVNKSLDKAGLSRWSRPSIMRLQMKDPFIRYLRRNYSKVKDVEGMRLGPTLIGGRFIEDSIVYQIR